MEQNIQNSSERTINDKWLDNIYNILLRLETADKLANEGCRDLIEYIQTPEQHLPMIQYKNYTLFLTEFEILINNCQKMLPDKKYEEFVKNLEGLRKAEKVHGEFLIRRFNNIQKTEKYSLRPVFNDAIKIISRMRRDVVSCLWPVLSPSARDNSDKLPE